MLGFPQHLSRRLPRALSGRRTLAVVLALLGVALAASTATAAFLLHFNLSTAGSLELLLIVLVALRLGFVQSTVVSVAAGVCLNFLFTPPVFTFSVADPKNWVSLITFEATALLVSRLSSEVRQQAARADLQRVRTEKLYQLSRAILLIDGHSPTTTQLATLIRELLDVEEVQLWALHQADHDGEAADASGTAHAAFRAGVDNDEPDRRTSTRLLRLGTVPIGAMVLSSWDLDPLLADAVASLAALAIERSRATEKEGRAEAGRRTEQLRTAVLDGLAHGFKTPLTAIQAASSGLLAIGELSETQAELVSLIDERAAMLNQLSTRLLQTAALESREIRLRRSMHSIVSLAEDLVSEQDEIAPSSVRIFASPELRPVALDPELVGLAMLQLIDNAAKYATPETAIDLAIRQDEAETTITVTNEGSFIPVEQRERIFDRFYRAVDPAHAPPGTGLGLSIVKKTAEAHGGRAWAECDDGKTHLCFTIQHTVQPVTGSRHG